ncbi:hypothetical protein I4U23_004906 [Adineta vaga]|nr:hypothetical protein I4U23_004906 [Adineta vaga]
MCQISILFYPIPMNLISTVVTVVRNTNTTYGAPAKFDCICCSDYINNFILNSELGTQINDLNT